MKKAIIDESGVDVYNFLEKNTNINDAGTLIISTSSVFNISNQPDDMFSTIINLKRTNDIQRVNKFLEAVNAKIPNNGFFIGCVETKNQRKIRIFKKFPAVINGVYYTLDFVVKRIFPKFLLTKKIYFFITGGRNRVITKTEILGRLYSCGFELSSDTEINGIYYFIVHKVNEPKYDLDPTYGPLVRLSRVGKNGKIIKVYKMRTMHPYSEYLQKYIYEKYSLQAGGKFKNDFRVSTAGRIMRKFWLDELPMLFNLLKGNMKLVGVRPLSSHYFSLYDQDLQEMRIKQKPGLIPPFYVDLPETLEEIQNSERKYLKLYEKHPLITDVKYFAISFYNIVFKRKRSN